MNAKTKSLFAIDALGGAVTAGLLVLCGWAAFLEQPEEGHSARDLGAELSALKSEVAGLRSSLTTQENKTAEAQTELASVGPMPSQSPAEEYLQILSSLAAENQLSVLRQAPLPAREYPGLLEQRFAYEVAGEMINLTRFFKAVEESPCWTDISYLKIEPVKDTAAARERSALLTFSVFSTARPSNPEAPQGG